jgi:uncharacterized protein YciI
MAQEKLQFMYVMQPTDPTKAASRDNWTPQDQATFGEHWANLERLKGEGVLILAGRAQDADGCGPAICIIEVDSEAEARRIFASERSSGVASRPARCIRIASRYQGASCERG